MSNRHLYGDISALLCDADGNLFPSEEPAFVASARVTNRFLRDIGVDREYSPTELRLATTGKNFRSTIVELAASHGIPIAADLDNRTGEAPNYGRRPLTADEVARWVAEEKDEVSAYLSEVLKPDPEVLAALEELSRRFLLAVVSSSALSRLDACFKATGLEPFFPPERRFSAEDSLPRPTSKPDPAVYTFAATRLGMDPAQCLAVEDSIPGAQSAIAAGCPTVGNVRFVPEREREGRVAGLEAAGVVAVIDSWGELAEVVETKGRTR